MPDDAFDYLDDVLARLKMTKAERGRLYKHLSCPNCETQLSDPPFELVAVYSDQEVRKIRRQEKYVRDLAPKLRGFHKFLADYPGLGGLHDVGRKLAEAVKRAKVATMDDTTWYRARSDEGKPLSVSDFLPPDPKSVALLAGRFNYAGQVGYYVADTPETAAVEKLRFKKLRTNVWVAAINFVEPLKALDLRTCLLPLKERALPLLLEGIAFTGSVSEPVNRRDKSCPQYRVPQYIADLVRWRRPGVHGILYTCSRESPFNNPEAWGTNLVLVNRQLPKIRVEVKGKYKWVRTTFCEPFNLPTRVLRKVGARANAKRER